MSDVQTEFKDQAGDKQPFAFLKRLEEIIDDRITNPQADSYVSKLNARGMERILQKVGEEAVEVVLAGAYGSNTLKEEAADLIFHLLIALRRRHVKFQTIVDILEARDKTPKAALTPTPDAVTLTG